MQNLASHWEHWTVAGKSWQKVQRDSPNSATRSHQRHQRIKMPRALFSGAFYHRARLQSRPGLLGRAGQGDGPLNGLFNDGKLPRPFQVQSVHPIEHRP